MKLYLFDCDGTLWRSDDNDYIGSIISELKIITDDCIERAADNKRFILFDGVRDMFKKLVESDSEIGIVSDNPSEMVKEALLCFDLYKYINPEAFNVRLWKGYCPKHIMVEEILARHSFVSVDRTDVIWYDDKDYSKEAKTIGVTFIHISEEWVLGRGHSPYNR